MKIDILQDCRIVALDVETVNTSKKNNVIIQLGVVEVINGEVVQQACKTFGGGKSSEAALAKHRISDESRVGLPCFEEKAASVANYLSGAILLGHNALKFDVPIIDTICRKIGEPIRGRVEGIPVIDTLPLVRRSIHSPSYTLGTICGMLGVVYGEHDAGGDALSAWNVFLKILQIQTPSSLDRYISYYKPE